jgi:hypothetical protein
MTPDYAAAAHREARRDRHRPATTALPRAIPQRSAASPHARPSPIASVALSRWALVRLGKPAKAADGDTSLREQRTELLAVPLARTRSANASTPTRSTPKSLLRAPPATGGTQSCQYHRRPAHAVDQALANGSANEPGPPTANPDAPATTDAKRAKRASGAGGDRTHDRRIMRMPHSLAGFPPAPMSRQSLQHSPGAPVSHVSHCHGHWQDLARRIRRQIEMGPVMPSFCLRNVIALVS